MFCFAISHVVVVVVFPGLSTGVHTPRRQNLRRLKRWARVFTELCSMQHGCTCSLEYAAHLTRACTYARTHAHICTHACPYMYARMCTHACACAYTCIHAHTLVCSTYTHAYTHIHSHAVHYAYTHIHSYVCVHTCIHTHTLIRMRIHTCSMVQP